MHRRTSSRRNLQRFLGRTQKFWDQSEKYDSHSLRYVKQVSGKMKDHRLRKIQDKIPHQRSPYAVKNLRTDLKKRLQDNSDAPKARHGILLQTYKLKEKDKATFYSPKEECVFPVTSIKEPKER